MAIDIFLNRRYLYLSTYSKFDSSILRNSYDFIFKLLIVTCHNIPNINDVYIIWHFSVRYIFAVYNRSQCTLN